MCLYPVAAASKPGPPLQLPLIGQGQATDLPPPQLARDHPKSNHHLKSETPCYADLTMHHSIVKARLIIGKVGEGKEPTQAKSGNRSQNISGSKAAISQPTQLGRRTATFRQPQPCNSRSFAKIVIAIACYRPGNKVDCPVRAPCSGR